jgi:hypothetical protein
MQDFFYNAGCFFIIGTQVVSPVNTDQVVQVVTGGAGATYVAENSFLKATVCVGVLSTTYYALRLVRLLVHFLTKLKHN